MTTKEFINQQIAILISENKRLISEYSDLFENGSMKSENAERLRSMAKLLDISTVAANNLFLKSNDLCQVCHTEDEIAMASTSDDYKETA